MRQSQKFFEATDLSLYRRYLQQMLIMTGLILFFLSSGSAFALAPNPGAVCSTDFSKDGLDNADYQSLISSLGNFVNVAGNASGSIPLQVKLSIKESSTSNRSIDFETYTASNKAVINIGRNFPTISDYTDITFEFRNSLTLEPIFLTNVALSAFDIDYSNNTNNRFYDYVKFSGITASNNEINSVQQTSTSLNSTTSFIDNYQQEGLFTGNDDGRSFNCTARNLDTRCQGSVQFNQPIKSVKVRYTNTGTRITSPTTPTNQEVDISLDNYCYVPEYIFSGTIFNDNGGITDTQADATNANVNSGTYSNKPNYFNGVFNSPQETGIEGSTVKLASCADTTTTYTTKSVIKSGAPIGEYQISIPKTALPSNTNLCLVESRSGNTYPIRTTSESRNVGFTATTYNYPDNNFGRVIAANAAIVLRKAQYVNSCPATLNYSASNINISGNTDPRAGFSESGINGSNLIPGQCIAYRITATNRANLPVNNFVMRDKLQTKEDGALVTSFLTGPSSNASEYATNSVAIGQNGSVITKALTLNPKAIRNFYFNTKYGTTNGSTP